MSDVILHRVKSPWLWPDLIYNMCPSGRIHNNCLKILHGFTNKVILDSLNERNIVLYCTVNRDTREKRLRMRVYHNVFLEFKRISLKF
jgi:hypothetical protein